METTDTRAAAFFGSSAAADIPIGKASAAPIPHSAAPAVASHTLPASTKRPRPAAAAAMLARSTATRPYLSITNPPQNRMAVMARTKTANISAPVDSLVPRPSTEALAIQSFPAPSVRVAPRTTTPISRVRPSRQAEAPFGAAA